jgi:hypothetical protein
MSPTDRPARRRASTALADTDRDLIQYIVDHADLLDVVTFGRGEGAKRVRYQVGPSVYADDVITPDSTHWLLVPMTTEMLTRLASFGADREDLEPDADREADDCDAEITYPSNVDQSYLALVAKQCGADDDDEPDGSDEPELGWESWVPDWSSTLGKMVPL